MLEYPLNIIIRQEPSYHRRSSFSEMVYSMQQLHGNQHSTDHARCLHFPPEKLLEVQIHGTHIVEKVDRVLLLKIVQDSKGLEVL